MTKILRDQSLTQAQIYFQFYLFQAMKKAGMGDQYLDHLTSWKNMLNNGLTTFAEKEVEARSDCHAWSSHPIIDLLATVCGIEPAATGFSKVSIKPHFGDLDFIEGQVVHPDGMITVNLKKNGNRAIRGEIILPEGLEGILYWKSKEHDLKGGSQKINIE